jgi:hypothetical protein
LSSTATLNPRTRALLEAPILPSLLARWARSGVPMPMRGTCMPESGSGCRRDTSPDWPRIASLSSNGRSRCTAGGLRVDKRARQGRAVAMIA